ncbi:hypothetical protein CLOM_g16619 [Closterium sp. NIES-68]|nr:hypothetical protein CLOM_g16619 [Closterium sp. NIES-68]
MSQEQLRREDVEGQGKEQFSTEPTQETATAAPGYAGGGTAVSAPGYAGGGYVATATGPGFTCTAQEFPTAGGGATGVAAVTDTEGRTIYYSTTMQPMGVSGPGVTETGVTATGVPATAGADVGATGGGDTEMMGGDVGGESIGARGSAEPAGGEKSLAAGGTPEGVWGRPLGVM